MVAAAYNEKAPPTNSLRWTVTLSVSYSRHNRRRFFDPSTSASICSLAVIKK